MENQTVFVKRYPSKGELPQFKDGVYQGYFHTEFGLVKYSKYDGWKLARKYPDYFLEEVEWFYKPINLDEISSRAEKYFYNQTLDESRVNDMRFGLNFILSKIEISKDNY